MPRTVTVLIAVLFVVWPAWAQEGNPFDWLRPSAEDQLADDDTVIPIGKGAIFVPSLTDPLNEPPAILVDGDDVDDIPTGERVLVDPGAYTVIVSSGSPGQGVGQAVDVVEGETTLVKVTWGALRIEVVDEKRIPHRGSYELINAENREPWGTGFGADTFQGEQLTTWLLKPGVYRIVRPGANYRALTNFATVFVPEGGFVRYRLVTDPDTGEFRGAGVLLPGEFGSPRNRNRALFTSLVVGVDGQVSQQRNVVGGNNQTILNGNLFVDGQVAWNRNNHHVVFLTQVAEGASQIRPLDSEPLEWVKVEDELRADLLYTWFVHPRVGPYVRAAGETQAFPSALLFVEPTTIVRQQINGSVRRDTFQASETLRVADPWTPTIVREGAGVNTRLLNDRWVSLNFRLGLGLRQNRFAGSYVQDDNAGTPNAIEYTQVDSFDQQGVESTIVATARLPGWVVYSTDVELFSDFDTFGEPSIEWRNTLSLRITRNLSLNYRAKVDRLPQVVDAVQLDHNLLLRASWELL